MNSIKEASSEGRMYQDNDPLEEASEGEVMSRALVVAGSLKTLDPILPEKIGQFDNAAGE